MGSLIGSELRRQRRPAAWLAQEICCDRTNVYKILRKGSIDTELLCRISVALEHDFFAELQAACGFQQALKKED
ncbi:MAG: XRE family transcriptional regulator [Bacteroidales bacterium]|nr:XRE family transcriptional regulator [Bacteroidales bacterium]